MSYRDPALRWRGCRGLQTRGAVVGACGGGPASHLASHSTSLPAPAPEPPADLLQEVKVPRCRAGPCQCWQEGGGGGRGGEHGNLCW